MAKLLPIRFSLACVLFIWCAQMFAANVSIQGNAFFYRGKSLEIKAYSDLFTFESHVLAKLEIPVDGGFSFKLNIDKTGLYLIKIEKVHAHIYLEPGVDYTLVIPEPELSDQYSHSKDVFVLPEIYESGSTLNQDITAVERTINRFLIAHSHMYGRSVNRQIIPLADSLTQKIKADFSSNDNTYFQSHLHFRLATFEIETNHSRNQIFERYFANRTPAYDQLSFANAFSLFFTEYLEYLNPKSAHRFQHVADSAIKTANYHLLIDCMQVDPYLKSRSYRELLAATELYEYGAERKYDSAKILILLDSIMMNAQDEACRTIAANAEQKLTRLAVGSKSPNFEFADVMGNIYRLSEYEGRYIYIQFFDDFDSETLKEMGLMKVLKEGFGSDVAMFSISTAAGHGEIKTIVQKHRFDWVFGKAQSPEEIIEQFDLRAYPTYFYLDKDLNLIKSPAPSPGASIEKLFAKSWNEEHPNKALLFKLQPPEVSEPEPPKPLD